MPEKVLLSADEVLRAMRRIAHEIVERNRGAQDLVFVGIMSRGVPIAKRLAALIKEFEGADVPVGSLDIGLYRDDVLQGASPQLRKTDIPGNLQGKRVILVDDVLYTGRTIRAAMDAVMDFGRPKAVQLAVLVDRGHRELPIRADYVGKNVPTAQQEEVQVKLKESDGLDQVVIVEAASGKQGPGGNQ
ncbi:MAG: bifunctional pyr operon transcriptional regulator/uracil phosphoribosyltransferase PyrR [Chloroflexi bacterium]|nr:bifunctional pyr operon transcriptional regulator/uracil phosphoribosyltransferase PyrR [Chloroflexota bacterium]